MLIPRSPISVISPAFQRMGSEIDYQKLIAFEIIPYIREDDTRPMCSKSIIFQRNMNKIFFNQHKVRDTHSPAGSAVKSALSAQASRTASYLTKIGITNNTIVHWFRDKF